MNKFIFHIFVFTTFLQISISAGDFHIKMEPLSTYSIYMFFFLLDFFLSNLNSSCLRCLCEGITNCDTTRQCQNEYCGPFYLSRIYWVRTIVNFEVKFTKMLHISRPMQAKLFSLTIHQIVRIHFQIALVIIIVPGVLLIII